MAATGSWTDEPIGSARSKTRKAPRSLGAALRDAGLSDAAPERRDANEVIGLLANSASALKASSAIARARSPHLAVFDGAASEESRAAAAKAARPHSVATPTPGVVSPPPWLRAARRGRWRNRMLNTFGWAMTIIVAGSIIGLTGRYLAVPQFALHTTMQARQ